MSRSNSDGRRANPLGIVLITVPIFVPLFAALKLDLVWLGVLVVKYVEIGMLTPPVGFNVYVVKSVVGETIPLEKIFQGCFWFPRLRSRDHDLADRVPADFTLVAECDELTVAILEVNEGLVSMGRRDLVNASSPEGHLKKSYGALCGMAFASGHAG